MTEHLAENSQWSAERWSAKDQNVHGYGELLSASPIIVQIFYPSPGLPLGAASMLEPLLRHRAVHYLVMLHWTIEPPFEREQLVQIIASYAANHPRHEFIFLCNTPNETKLLSGEGFSALTINHNCLVDETIFKPMPTIVPIYDALYNACLAEYKRHELAAEIEKIALVYYHNEESSAEFQFECARLRAMMPTAYFANGLPPEGWRWIPGPELNKIMAQSLVGLCLSQSEGAMRASVEYLFAGLSVVSTPSLGGRDRFFDDEFCIITKPDPRQIREAVVALAARNVPRDYVRAKTLARVESERSRYINLVQELIDRAGGNLNFADHFLQLTRGPTIVHWRSMREFSELVAAAVLV